MTCLSPALLAVVPWRHKACRGPLVSPRYLLRARAHRPNHMHTVPKDLHHHLHNDPQTQLFQNLQRGRSSLRVKIKVSQALLGYDRLVLRFLLIIKISIPVFGAKIMVFVFRMNEALPGHSLHLDVIEIIRTPELLGWCMLSILEITLIIQPPYPDPEVPSPFPPPATSAALRQNDYIDPHMVINIVSTFQSAITKSKTKALPSSSPLLSDLTFPVQPIEPPEQLL
ncbi:hypothetical protein GYMLUDRAFT_245647 [Collybiopsis luxurians FD-317 M1]|uniref:Uncharacterized protein n=1 Tax=Collybiopsis luxurians FD-317 M1 TaxID=944289 RepID=A0A0D0CT08_9AGAR|nr:hypothetical protein GYMLUDRAFT_245647 [Collybiopsis luxurians FD-317 M1]